jgi:hypothetical protein
MIVNSLIKGTLKKIPAKNIIGVSTTLPIINASNEVLQKAASVNPIPMAENVAMRLTT